MSEAKIYETDAQVAFDAGAALAEFRIVDGKIPLAIIPEGYTVQSLERHKENPSRKKGRIVLHDGHSLIGYVNDHKDDDSRIYVSINDKGGGATFVCVLDHHRANEAGARWGDHLAIFTPRPTVEWLAWQKNNRQNMQQVPFAEFLEENAKQIVAPDAVRIIELALDFQAKTDVEFTSAIRLTNGNVTLRYQENTTQQGEMQLPAELTLGLRLFEGGQAYEMKARLRYRLEHRQVVFRYELVNPHLIVRDAIESEITVIADRTGIEVLHGDAPSYQSFYQ